jgi:glucose-6-phosphate 1-epimerase
MAGRTETTIFQGLPAVRMVAPDGASAIVTLHGAHVVSWVPANGRERLYLSERSGFAAGSAIRGGIPVIFPRFATEAHAPDVPRHGFARTTEWTHTEARCGEDFAMATLRLTDSPATRTLWPHAFAAELTAVVGGNRLDVELELENLGEAAFSFTAALHTYLRVREVETVRLEGLHGTHYRDSAHGGREADDTGEVLTVADELDRIYFDLDHPLLLRAPEGATGIGSEGFPDVVVWNPWEAKCAALADMPPDGFRHMLCIEAAAIGSPVRLEPAGAWWGRQSLIAM